MIDLAEIPLLTATLLAMGLSLILMIVIPVLPGQFFIWLAALVFGWLTEWEFLNVRMFILLTLLMLLAAGIDLVAGWLGARKGGASWPAIAVGFVLGLIGLIIFNAIGAIIGIVAGIVGYEYSQYQDWPRAWKAGGGYLGGMLISLITRFVISLAMVALFVWQVI